MGVGTTDIELLAAIADRDRAALRELYERHAGWLVLRLSRRCGDADIVNEAVQDTFVAVWRKPSAYQGSGDVAAWLWGIAFRRMLDRVRRRSRWETVAEFIKPGVVASAEDEVLIGIEHSDAGTALDRLSHELKAVVQAMVLDGLTARETASLLGIPAGTVKTRMMRARRLLREDLAT
jgi:RNA polymerase sigma-70 factor (ECF subfamily)